LLSQGFSKHVGKLLAEQDERENAVPESGKGTCLIANQRLNAEPKLSND